ncbi:hypothetical protein ABIB26_001971 [Arthrobacter sp. UYEF20]
MRAPSRRSVVTARLKDWNAEEVAAFAAVLGRFNAGSEE